MNQFQIDSSQLKALQLAITKGKPVYLLCDGEHDGPFKIVAGNLVKEEGWAQHSYSINISISANVSSTNISSTNISSPTVTFDEFYHPGAKKTTFEAMTELIVVPHVNKPSTSSKKWVPKIVDGKVVVDGGVVGSASENDNNKVAHKSAFDKNAWSSIGVKEPVFNKYTLATPEAYKPTINKLGQIVDAAKAQMPVKEKLWVCKSNTSTHILYNYSYQSVTLVCDGNVYASVCMPLENAEILAKEAENYSDKADGSWYKIDIIQWFKSRCDELTGKALAKSFKGAENGEYKDLKLDQVIIEKANPTPFKISSMPWPWKTKVDTTK